MTQNSNDPLGHLGTYVAPDGLYAATKARPFLGEIRCNPDQVIAGSWPDVVLTYAVGACGIADAATFTRSEERPVGHECRSRRLPHH